MRQPKKTNEFPLQPQIVIEPFEKWASYFIGLDYVCTYYVTNWVEATWHYQEL